MSHTIGECKCINPLDKDEIILALNNEIERHEEKIGEIKEGKFRSEIASPETLIKMHESIKKRMETVKMRIENTPECIT